MSGSTNIPIAGATNASFTTAALTANGSFWAAVGDPAGVVESAAATVTVIPLNQSSLSVQMVSGLPSLTLSGLLQGASYRVQYSTDLSKLKLGDDP